MAKKNKSQSSHREVEFLDTLRRLGGSARSASLAEAMAVSEETIRRTAKALAKAGQVVRVRGGVYLANTEAGETVFSRIGRRTAEKRSIAAAAVEFVPDGSSVFLDVGSTTTFVAEALRARKGLTVITNSLNAALALVHRNDNRVFLAGGELGHIECGAFGPEALSFIKGFNIDTNILSVDGIDPKAGFLVNGAAEAALSRCAVQQAQRSIIVADHSKFGQNASMIACTPSDVDVLITDRAPVAGVQTKLSEWGIELIFTDKEPSH